MTSASEIMNGWSGPSSCAELDFTEAEVQVYGPYMGAVAIMRDTLRHQGFRRITAHTKPEDLIADLAARQPDLLVVDVDEAPDKTCEIVRDIRFRREGTNPFIPVVAMSGGVQQIRASLIVNSGTDDVWLRPASASAVRTRLGRLVRSRKQFVGTPSYVGPDRRGPDRAGGGGIPLLDVPNRLRSRVLGITGESEADSIEETYRELATQQVRRMGFAIRSAVQQLRAMAASGQSARSDTRLQRLCGELDGLTAQLTEQGYTNLSGMLELAQAALAENAKADTLTAKQLEVLQLHGDSLIATVCSGGEGQEVLGTGLQQAAVRVGRKSHSAESRAV